ncbi:TrbG/VirB9 family P-type conjugative transfer protein [Terricaulis silvestris]|uniref:Conjugal transfer protein TrbG n=1 Tax=Terricaulis silvestris TaxID=2686094 RepID=A0A6I6MNM2_9CAUL|nr:TrbG/VirB9 family P-type conjugative transfer protein [Terricaulis silvestris]QGZ94958.1 conjugal transfer protein TrbG [Terricaulis silvestris]
MRSACVSVGLALIASCAFADLASAQARRTRSETPVEVLAAANRDARQSPTRDGFAQARHVYAYEPGALYEVYANPNYVSTILLEPGETLADIAAGDTSRWMVSQAEGESEGDARTIVLVKPNAAGLRTNIVLITDRRTYLIEALSQAGTAYSAQIAWSYPATSGGEGAAPIDAINLAYRIRTTQGRRPPWIPTRVFDDGRRTWIEFAADIVAAELPPLFVVTGEGAELVNYRVQAGPSGQRYMVDRVFDVGELRLGVRSPIVVRIERNPTDPRTSRARHGSRR